MTLRYLTINDLDQIEELDKKCFSKAVRYNRHDLTYYLSLPRTIGLAEVLGDKLIGFIIAAIVTNNYANVVTIDVDPMFRNRGIGNELIETVKVISMNLKIPKITLQVSVKNSVAINFYLKHGFQIIKKLPRYYPTTDGYQMEWMPE